jgi:hypothetical protein
MDKSYADMARKSLGEAQSKLCEAQDCLVEAKAPVFIHDSANRILRSLRVLQDEINRLNILYSEDKDG